MDDGSCGDLVMQYDFKEAQNDFDVPPEPYPEETRKLRPAMKAYLHGRDLSYTVAKNNMWYPTDEVRESDPVPRLVIPCVNEHGRPYWQARAMVTHDLRYRSAKGGRFGSIVVVWPEVSFSRCEDISFGNDSAFVDRPIVLVEGPTDALAAAGAGYLAIATMGAFFSGYALRYINKKTDSSCPIIVVPDLDMPQFGPDNVTTLAKAGRTAVMRMPEGAKDLAKMFKAGRKRLLERRI